ncbi:hypothetical protein N7454_001335 [Penicillium verhagenii]|nr:hypothetical protein N7454_001335 [Penicillium verhagenii]
MLATNYRYHSEIIVWSKHHIYAPPFQKTRQLFLSIPGKATREVGGTSWENDTAITARLGLVRALSEYTSGDNECISPKDFHPNFITLIAPYKAQVRKATSVFAQHGLNLRAYRTIDGIQGQEAKMIIILMTKPATGSIDEVKFLAHHCGLNVMLTRAKEVQVVIGNLVLCDSKFIANASRTKDCKNLATFLQHVKEK